MADRSHTHQTIPCKTPGCGGLAKCISSKLVAFNNWIARRRVRVCEQCGRKTKTLEFEEGVYTRGKVLPVKQQRTLFE